MAKATKQEIEDAFDEFLNETYKPYNILNPGDPYDRTGIMLYPAQILKNTDEIAYQTFLNDWADRNNIQESDEVDDLENAFEDDSDIPYDKVQTGADEHESDNSEESDNECEGHESLNGDMMGESYFCDGSCKTNK